MKIFTTPVEFHEELVSLGIYMGRYSFPNTKDRIPTCIHVIIYFVPNLKHRRWEFQYLVSCFHFRERMKLVGLFQNISMCVPLKEHRRRYTEENLSNIVVFI